MILKTKILLPSLLVLILFFARPAFSQNTFEPDPSKAEFITSDIPNFWKAFDLVDSVKNPFRDYLEKGSRGLKDFIPYRIESPKNLLKTVTLKKADYEKIREESYKVELQTGQVREFYKVFRELYEDAVFPPAYFVIGAFNSGGTSTKNGLIIGVEKQSRVEDIPYIVAHELVHFNQHYPGNPSLLEQSIKEGSADFIGELISGKQINEAALNYFNENEAELCAEFTEIMNGSAYQGWLYGTMGKKEGRPNDLGYSIGYKICESYYSKSENKKEAIREILNIGDFGKFLEFSGYLAPYTAK